MEEIILEVKGLNKRYKSALTVIATIVVMLLCLLTSMFFKGQVINYTLPINNFDSLSILFIENINFFSVVIQRIIYSIIFIFITAKGYNNMTLD